MDIAEQERKLYAEVFESIDEYVEFSSGEQNGHLFLQMAQPVMDRRPTVLDAGSGSGKGAVALDKLGFAVTCCDLGDHRMPEAQEFPFRRACLWTLDTSERYDYVYCCDVLEHLPKEFTMLAVARLLATVNRGAFLEITLAEDRFGLLAGQPLHQTVESFVWWRDRIASIGRVVEARDLLISGAYYVEPR